MTSPLPQQQLQTVIGESSAAVIATTTGSVNYSNNSTTQTLVHEQQVELFLLECGLSQYLSIFIEEGFDRLESVSI
jgi:hypothetical protein